MKTTKKFNVGKAVAYWNVEHTPKQRRAHLDRVNEIISLLGYGDVLEAKDVSLPDWDSKPGPLGFPATRIDVVLKPKFRGRVWRESGTRRRVKWMSVIHLTFRLCAGITDKAKLPAVQDMVYGEHTARKAYAISKWPGWDGLVAEYGLVTNGRWCGYGRRNWC